MNKQSFIFYTEWLEFLEDLPPEDFKAVIEGICKFCEDGQDPTLPPSARVAYKAIKNVVRQNNEKYEAIKRKRSEAGKQGGAPKGNRNASKNKQNQAEQASVCFDKQKQTKQAKQAKQAVTVTDTVTDTVTELAKANDDYVVNTPPPTKTNPSQTYFSYEKAQAAADYVMNNPDYRANVEMKSKMTASEIQSYIPEFVSDAQIARREWHGLGDFTLHLGLWLVKKKQYGTSNNQGNRGPGARDSQGNNNGKDDRRGTRADNVAIDEYKKDF